MRLIFLSLALLLGACTTAPAPAPAPSATTRVGAVSSADPRASQAGMEILRAGGNAADAAVAVMLALTVVEPQSSGIGGGGFLLHHEAASGRLTSFDGREVAPAAATPSWFLEPDGRPMPRREAVPGGRSVGVPGNIRLAELVHERHGQLPWARLFEPAIRLADQGFVITPRLHRALARPGSLAGSTAWGRDMFYVPDGGAKPAGTLVRNPELARLLREIAARGPEAYYTGPAARRLVAAVRGAENNPSPMSPGDLATYSAVERPPVCAVYRAHRICGMGPPSSGATSVIAILKQLERFDLRALGPRDPRAWHLIAESMRLAYADREAYVADPDHVAVPTAGLVDPRYLAHRSASISPGSAMEAAPAGRPPGAPDRVAGPAETVPSTSHLVTADRDGNVVSYTSTIEGPFGSGLTVDGHYLNNELTDFTFMPEVEGERVANRVEGGKRPRSSMSPTIVYGPDGEIRVAIGAAGGLTIIAQVAKALIGIIDWDLGAHEAIALPQVIGMGNRVLLERGTPAEALAAPLRALGHDVSLVEPGYKANALERLGERWVGAADPRSEGVAIVE